MNLSDYGRSLIRTFVPLVVGSFVAWLATRGVEIDRNTLIGILDPILATAYYAGVRAIEKRWPRAGWLLGAPGAPSYASGGSPSGPSAPIFSAPQSGSEAPLAGSEPPSGLPL